MGCQIFVCGTLSPDSESCIADLIFQLQDSFDGIHSINHVARSVRKRNQSHLLARDDDAVNNDRHGNRIKTNFVTGTETICTRNSLSFYPHSRTVTPRYLPPSITDSVTSQEVKHIHTVFFSITNSPSVLSFIPNLWLILSVYHTKTRVSARHLSGR
jgi:hypothetical protein